MQNFKIITPSPLNKHLEKMKYNRGIKNKLSIERTISKMSFDDWVLNGENK